MVKIGAIGDCIHTLPLARALRQCFPKAYLAWIVGAEAKDVPADQDGIDEVIVSDTRAWRRLFRAGSVRKAYRAVAAFRRRLTDASFDLAVDAQGSIKSGLMARLTGAPVRVGFTSDACREPLNTLFTTHRVSPRGTHVIEQNLSLLTLCGGADIQMDAYPRFSPTYAAVERVVAWRGKVGIAADSDAIKSAPLVAIHPGGGYASKRWPLKAFITLASRLAHRWTVIITPSPGEQEDILDRLDAIGSKKPIVAPPMGLSELAALYQQCHLMIASDTGPLHLAAAAGCRTVGLFGPSASARNGPYGTHHYSLQQYCACRGKRLFPPRKCSQRESCIESLTVDDVYQVVCDQMARIAL